MMGYTNSSLVNYTKLSPNHSGLRNHEIDTITIHCVVGQVTVERLGEIFAPETKQASSNYGIGFDGRIGMYVEEKNRSWCSSSASNDNRAVTIEVASDTAHPYAVTDKAYDALIELVADICKRNGIKKLLWKGDKSLIGQVDKQNMTVHRWFASKACPGDYLYNRHGEIAEKVNEKLSGSETGVLYKVQVGAFSKKENAENMLAKLEAAGFDGFIVTVGEKSEDSKQESVPVAPTFVVGEKVRLDNGAPVYGTNVKFASWVYNTDLYVRQINGDKVVVSTLKTGAVTGSVDKKYLNKL